jgi:hypothetical protein
VKAYKVHNGLDYLLDLNGEEFTLPGGYWAKFEATLTVPTIERPHGIRYCLTLHDRYNKRIFGFDNAHAIKPGKKFKGRIVEYDHMHKNWADKGTAYEFINANQLLEDFFRKVDEIITGGRIQ